MAETAKWYVVHTYSGYENKVKTSLEKTVENRRMHDMIVDIKVPTEIVKEIKEDSVKEVERKIFPGYVLVKMVMTPETRYIVRNVRGCTGFVGPESEPVPLSEEDIARMGVETKIIEVSYAVGDSVRISDGLLEGNIGVVEEISLDKNKVKVIVTMFGRETPVELDLEQVEVLD